MRVLSCAALGFVFVTTTLAAQTPHHPRILGVFDAETGTPIAGAVVRDVITGTRAVTTKTGTVSLDWIKTGGTIVQVLKLGYQPWSQLVDAADTSAITVVMSRIAELAPVVTTEKYLIEHDPGAREGFEARCAAANVSCVRDSLLAQYPARTIGDMLLHSPTVKPCGGSPRASGGLPASCAVLMAGTIGSCAPTYYVDGFKWDAARMGAPIDPAYASTRVAPLDWSNIAGIEVYPTTANRPARFNGDPDCGVIVLWTK